jgi:GT2 family glycosyltransferase
VRLVERLEADPGIGLIGPLILLPDGRVQASARRFPSLGRLLLSELWLHRLLSRPRATRALLGHWFDHGAACDADWLVGACLLLPRATFTRTGGFDARIFMYGEEVEWCRRVRALGLRVVFDPAARVRHLNHQSADRLFGDDGRVDRCLISEHQLLRRWQGLPASAAAHVVRLLGALLRLLLFGLRRLTRPGDAYARDVLADARSLFAHYGRRLRGRTWRPA